MFETLYKCNKICGIWPTENLIICYVLRTINIGLIIYMTTGFILYTIKIFNDNNATVLDVIDALFTMITSTNFTFNYIGCIITNVNVNKIVKIMVGYSMLAGILVNLYPWITYKTCIEIYADKGSIGYCGFCCGFYYPFHCNKGISFGYHLVCMIYATCLLCIAAILFICGGYCAIEAIVLKINHLKIMLSEVSNIPDIEEKIFRLKVCIKYHIYIISHVDELNASYSIMCIQAICFYSVVIGLSLFSFTEEFNVKAGVNVTGYIVGTLVLCMVGQKLLDESESISFAAYNMNWYETSTIIRKYVLLIMIRAQKPLTFNAGPFAIFSVPVFMQVVRGAYTYMTMQSNIKKD